MKVTERLTLYAVTDGLGAGEGELKKIFDAIEGGVSALQIRQKDGLRGFETVMRAIHERCENTGALLLVDDDADFAMEFADGVHLGADDESISLVRKRAPSGFIIGATAKTAEAARRAEGEGADYLGCGAMFPSVTKPGAVPMTKEKLTEIVGAVSIPVVAIGGITAENICSLEGLGLTGVAVSEGIFGGKDVKARAEKLRTLCEKLFKNTKE
ncbi:MAG: thiamine phosphate synthase [Clostridia bacterium]|nr:thiamine phosphate synthase [Clostridia bacterium]